MKSKKNFNSWVIPGLTGMIAAAFVSAFWHDTKFSADTRSEDFSTAVAQNEGGGSVPFVSEFESADADKTSTPGLEMYADIAKLLCDNMPEVHLLHKIFDEAMSVNAWTNYLNSLDYQHVFFVQSDIDEFEVVKTRLPREMKAGDLTFPKTVFNRLRDRVRDRVDFVESNVTNKINFTTDKTYQWKRDELPWPADAEEQDELWRGMIANSLISSMVSTTLANEKNTSKKDELRLSIATYMHGERDTTNSLAEAELSEELERFDAAVSALPTLPTNATLRAEFCKVLVPSWQSPDASTNEVADVATNSVPEVVEVTETPTDPVSFANLPELFAATDVPTDQVIAPNVLEVIATTDTSTNQVLSVSDKLDSLVLHYVAAATGIKSEEEGLAEAAEKTIKSYRQYLNILTDSDEEFYLSKFFNAMTTAYDPHSSYLSPIAQEDFGIDMQLSLQGIGAQLQTEDGAAKIAEIIPGSPAERDLSETRLVPSDKIIGVAQADEEFVDIRHWPLYKAVRLIRGPKGSVVRLQVIPANDANSIKIVTLVRDEIKLEEQAASSRLEEVVDATGVTRKLGYVKLPTFYSSMKLGANSDATPRSATIDVARLIADLNTEDVEGLVLDLRGNGGGSLPEAIYLTGLFIRTGPVVQVKESRRTITLPDNDPAIAFTKPMIVMIDRLSASASEIVAGALQDYGRAIVVGDSHTHGKGTVQTLIPVRNGDYGSLKVTTASFFRITGSSTQIRGVSADIRLPSLFEHYSQLGEDKLPNAIPWSRTGPARYKRVDSLDETIVELAENSTKRLATNEKWQNHIKILDRFGSITTNTIVSLNFETRMERAKEDEKLQREISADNALADGETGMEGGLVPIESEKPHTESKKEREERFRKHDVVLDETLNVLTDLIDIHGQPRNLNDDKMPYDFLNTFFR